MTGEKLFNEFKKMFPLVGDSVVKYKKIGSKTIRLYFEDGFKPLLFMYKNDNDWTLGTKVWRMKPNNKKKEV